MLNLDHEDSSVGGPCCLEEAKTTKGSQIFTAMAENLMIFFSLKALIHVCKETINYMNMR